MSLFISISVAISLSINVFIRILLFNQVAVNHCGSGNPVEWLQDNWENMMETVMTLASNVGHEAEENTVGEIKIITKKIKINKKTGKDLD